MSSLSLSLNDIKLQLLELSREHQTPVQDLIGKLGILLNAEDGVGAASVVGGGGAVSFIGLGGKSRDGGRSPRGAHINAPMASSVNSVGSNSNSGHTDATSMFVEDLSRNRSIASSARMRHRASVAPVVVASSTNQTGAVGAGDTNSSEGNDNSLSRSTTRSLRAIDRHTGLVSRVAELEENADEDFEEPRRGTLSTQEIRTFNRQVASTPAVGTKALYDLIPNVAFGVEIETLLAKRADEFLTDNSIKAIRDVCPQLMSALGPQYIFKFFDYADAKADREYNMWKVTTDLSIKPEDGRPIFGLEFVTPKLANAAGLVKLENVCEALRTNGFATNNTTALHVHVSCEGYSNERIRRLSSYIIFYECIVDQFMTLPRRADYSRYCRSNLKSVSMARIPKEAARKIEEVDVRHSLDKLISLVNPRLSNVKNSQRNHKVNYLLLKGTTTNSSGRRLEFRQHQGTCDKQEVSAWVAFLTRFVTKASSLNKPPWEFEGDDVPTLNGLWKLISDEPLKLFFTVKKETLPTKLDFTYDSREMYAFESDEEEIDDENTTVSAPPPPPAEQSRPISYRPVEPQYQTSSPHHPSPEPPKADAPTITNPRTTNGLNTIPVGPITVSATTTNSSSRPPIDQKRMSNSNSSSGGTDVTVTGSSINTQSMNSGSGMETSGTSLLFAASLNPRASTNMEQSLMMLRMGSGALSSAPTKANRSLWDVDVSTLTNFNCPVPVALGVEFYVEDIDVEDTRSTISNIGLTLTVNVAMSTNPIEASKAHSTSEWYVTAPAIDVARFVRDHRGVRVTSPFAVEPKKFSFLDDALSSCGPDISVGSNGAVFYLIDLSKFSLGKKRRLIESMYLFEEALATLLDAGDPSTSSNFDESGVTVRIIDVLYDQLDKRKQTYVEAIKWIRAQCGNEASSNAKDFPVDFVQMMTPSDYASESDRPFRLSFGYKNRYAMIRGKIASAQQMVMRTMFLSYFAARFVSMSDDELIQMAQAATMFGPMQLGMLKEKMDNTPDFIKTNT